MYPFGAREAGKNENKKNIHRGVVCVMVIEYDDIYHSGSGRYSETRVWVGQTHFVIITVLYCYLQLVISFFPLYL